MAGSISLSLSQQFDPSGKPYGGGQVYFIQAGTVATPQNAFQDLGLTLPWANPYTLLADGRLPQMYFADGYIKVRITDKTGMQIFNQDNIPVTGPSSGGGGGGGVDPTTVLQTGWLVPIYGVGTVTGFVRTNARSLGNATSGATERANADTAALFAFLWNADPNLVVSGGRGASAAADYAAGKTIALPDFRGRAIAGLDDMGNTAAGRLTPFGGNATVLGIGGGSATQTLIRSNLPNVAPTFTGNTISGLGLSLPAAPLTSSGQTASAGAGAGNTGSAFSNRGTVDPFTPSGSIQDINGAVTQTAFAIISPIILATIYLKL